MNHLPHKLRYVPKTLIWRPSELLRRALIAGTTVKFRYSHRCAEPHTAIGESTVRINTTNIHIILGGLI